MPEQVGTRSSGSTPARGRSATRLTLFLGGALFCLAAVSCSSGGSAGGTGGNASGSGGAVASGGATGTGGTSPSTGGAPATGGTVGTGGDSTGTGGTQASGGAGMSGGAAGTGPGTGGGDQTGGGGGTAGRGSGGGAGSNQAGGFALTSPSLTQGGTFPPELTCAGANRSPEFDWTAGPATTLSYALVLTDMANNLVHWVVWDIPPATRSLPAMLATTAMLATPAGARQLATGGGTAYTGPCPSGNLHTYQFDLHAVDTAMLPGVAAGAMTAQVKAAVMMHSIAKASLSAQSMAKRP